MSGDPEQEYFSDGIAEDILTDLSKIGGLIVIARNSSFAYKGRNVDLRIVGRDLGVGTVLEGSIRRAGNRVRITAQLIDAANGAHLWAERYDRDLTDIFAVQDDVTKRIVEALKITLTPGEEARLADTGTTNVAAHDLFLQGRDILTSPTINRDGYEKVLALGERALALDPDYGEAYAGLAFAHVFAYLNNWTSDPEKTLQEACERAEMANSLAPEDPTVIHSKALVAAMQKNVAESAAANERALAINPNHYDSLHLRGVLHLFSGNPRAAIPDIELAMRVNPEMNHRGLQFLGMAHMLLGNYETAAAMFRERIILVPDTDIGRAMLVATLGHLGELDEAKRVWGELMEIKPQYSPEEHAKRNFIDPAYAQPIINGFRKAGVLT
jgi:adenylate cyclase